MSSRQPKRTLHTNDSLVRSRKATTAKTDRGMSLIAEAAEWRLLSQLLERPRTGWYESMNTLATEVRDPALRAAVRAAQEASEGEYLQLIGPGGAVSPREVTYRPFADPGQLLAQLAAVYAAFSFRPRTEEPADHISVEASFVGYLFLKEAFASARGDAEAAANTATARAHFVENHLAAFGVTFAHRLENASGSYILPSVRCLAARLPAGQPVELLPPGALDLCEGCGAGATD